MIEITMHYFTILNDAFTIQQVALLFDWKKPDPSQEAVNVMGMLYTQVYSGTAMNIALLKPPY